MNVFVTNTFPPDFLAFSGNLVAKPNASLTYPNDLIQEITGYEIRGLTDELWKKLDIKTKVIESLAESRARLT